MKIKKDWWLANSVIYIATGLLSLFFLITGKELNLTELLTAAILLSGTEILIGLAFLKRSRLVFWIIFILIIFQSLGLISQISNGSIEIYSLKVLSVFIKLAFAVMLWQQIRREEKKK